MDKVHCFLCNHCFNYGEKSWPLFDNDFKETTEVAEALVSMLSKILDFQLELNEQKNLHLLTTICDACNANVLEYQKLTKKCLLLQQHIESIYYNNRKRELENLTLESDKSLELIIQGDEGNIFDNPKLMYTESNGDNGCNKNIFENNNFNDNLEKANKEVNWNMENYKDSIFIASSESNFSKDDGNNSPYLSIESQTEMYSVIPVNSMDSTGNICNQSELQISVLSSNIETRQNNSLQFFTDDDIIINKLNEKSEQFQVEETYDLPSNTNTSFSGNIDKHNQEQDFLNTNSFNLLADNNGDNAVDGLQFDSDPQNNDKNQSSQFNGIKLPKPIWNQKKTDIVREKFSNRTKSYICNLCPNTSKNLLIDRIAVENHFQTVHKCIYYTCELCEFGFSNHSDKLLHHHLQHKSHINGINESNPFNCSNSNDSNSANICINDSVSNKINKNTNTDNHSDVNDNDDLANDENNDITSLLQFSCDMCQNTFDSLSSLRLHKRTHSDDSIKPHECIFCYKKYSSQESLNEHLNSHTGERPYKCTECKKNFATRYTLQNHLKTHSDDKRLFDCDICQKSFSNQKNLKQHRKLHQKSINGSKYEFSKSDVQTKACLTTNSTNHTAQKVYICNVCGKSFARKPELDDHDRTHTGERPFKCDLCPLAFAQRSNLNTHKKITHYNEKTHECEECGRLFKRKRILYYHRLSAHTTERPHKCDICGSAFIYPEHYKKHMLIHSGHKPYACEICGKSFTSRDNRNSHRFVHSDKKLYECMECGAGFMRKPHLFFHMKQMNHISDAIIVNQPQVESADPTEEQKSEINDGTIKNNITQINNGNIISLYSDATNTIKLTTTSVITKISPKLIASLEKVQKEEMAPPKVKTVSLSSPIDTVTLAPTITSTSLTETAPISISTSMPVQDATTLMTTSSFMDTSIDSLVPSLPSIDTMSFVQYDNHLTSSDNNKEEVVLAEVKVDQLQIPSEQLLVDSFMVGDLLSTVDQELDVNYFQLNDDANLLM